MSLWSPRNRNFSYIMKNPPNPLCPNWFRIMYVPSKTYIILLAYKIKRRDNVRLEPLKQRLHGWYFVRFLVNVYYCRAYWSSERQLVRFSGHTFWQSLWESRFRLKSAWLLLISRGFSGQWGDLSPALAFTIDAEIPLKYICRPPGAPAAAGVRTAFLYVWKGKWIFENSGSLNNHVRFFKFSYKKFFRLPPHLPYLPFFRLPSLRLTLTLRLVWYIVIIPVRKCR